METIFYKQMRVETELHRILGPKVIESVKTRRAEALQRASDTAELQREQSISISIQR